MIYKISPLKHIKLAVMNERFLNLQQMVLASIALMESNSEHQEWVIQFPYYCFCWQKINIWLQWTRIIYFGFFLEFFSHSTNQNTCIFHSFDRCIFVIVYNYVNDFLRVNSVLNSKAIECISSSIYNILTFLTAFKVFDMSNGILDKFQISYAFDGFWFI